MRAWQASHSGRRHLALPHFRILFLAVHPYQVTGDRHQDDEDRDEDRDEGQGRGGG